MIESRNSNFRSGSLIQLKDGKMKIEQRQSEFPKERIRQEIQKNVYRVTKDRMGEVDSIGNSNGRVRTTMILKRISRQQIIERQIQKNVENELAAYNLLRSIKNPYLVTIYDFWKSPLYLNITMEEQPLGDLYNFLINEAAVENIPMLCVIFMLQLLYALTVTHSKKIIHRDVKPQNILLSLSTNELTLKLADFGQCTFDYHRPNSSEGTLFYMSPQIYILDNLDENYSYKPNCDLFSYGIILYQLNNGKHSKKNCLNFPYLENIMDKMDKDDEVKFNLQKIYYQKFTMNSQATINLRIMGKKGTNDEKRMQIFRQFIRELIRANPDIRFNFKKTYEFIQKNKYGLFVGLENKKEVQMFKDYYQMAQKIFAFEDQMEDPMATRVFQE